jgi:MoaA/NifB/PqqE/SkfB family radical SAM enzyme
MNYEELINFQKDILKNLNSENFKEIASLARNKIKELYGYPLPNGAEIGIFVNDDCNLKCPHCYVVSTHKKVCQREPMKLKDWSNVIKGALNLGVVHYSIIGKEPLLNPQVVKQILDELKGKKVFCEIITNGIMIPENAHWLKDYKFDFFSISFDGYKEDHDKIRGKGNYAKSKNALIIAKESGIENLTISHTIMPHNVKNLDKMIKDLAHCGAIYFSLGFCFPAEHNKKDFVAGKIGIYQEVIDKLKNLPETIDISLNISVENNARLIGELFRNGFFNEKCAVTEDLAPALIKIISNDHPRIALQISILPTMFYSGFRLECDGSILDHCIDAQSLERRKGFGNIKEQPFFKIWNKSRDQLWPQYTEKYYEYLAKALKGEELPVLKGWY